MIHMWSWMEESMMCLSEVKESICLGGRKTREWKKNILWKIKDTHSNILRATKESILGEKQGQNTVKNIQSSSKKPPV